MRGFINVIVHMEGSDRIMVEVKDSGIGIKREEQPTMFQMFGRVDNQDSQKRNTRGVGLGLTICKRLVEQFGGEIDFRSEYGVGSTFFFTLPVAECRVEQPSKELEEAYTSGILANLDVPTMRVHQYPDCEGKQGGQQIARHEESESICEFMQTGRRLLDEEEDPGP